MERNKFENDLRDKLNAREIVPNEKAWDRLDAMLAVAEEKKSKRSYGWLYIAASILGFVFIGTVFFSQTDELIDKGHNNVVLENATKESIGNNKEEILPAVSDSQAIASVEPTVKTESNQNHNNQSQPTNQSSIKKQINAVEAVNQIPDNQKLIASNNQSSNITNQNQSAITVGNQKTEQPSKVDELLAAAQNQQVHPKTSVKVNAKSLLSEVDGQVNLSFREKMLRRASEVAEVVANRNNE